MCWSLYSNVAVAIRSAIAASQFGTVAVCRSIYSVAAAAVAAAAGNETTTTMLQDQLLLMHAVVVVCEALHADTPPTDRLPVYFSGFLFWGCHGQVGGTRFQVSMTGTDRHGYQRPDD